jgi:hypothetical protein
MGEREFVRWRIYHARIQQQRELAARLQSGEGRRQA